MIINHDLIAGATGQLNKGNKVPYSPMRVIEYLRDETGRLQGQFLTMCSYYLSMRCLKNIYLLCGTSKSPSGAIFIELTDYDVDKIIKSVCCGNVAKIQSIVS